MMNTRRSFALLLGLAIVLLIAPVVRAENDWSIIKVSVAADGSEPLVSTILADMGRSVSADGRYVVFLGQCAALFPSVCTHSQPQVALRDTWTNTTELISVPVSGGSPDASSINYQPSISADGRYVLYYSSAPNLINGDTNGTYDVFVRDLQAGTTERVSVSDTEGQANEISWYGAMSDNGRYVVFRSYASNLVTGDSNGQEDIFMRDRTMGSTSLVSVHTSGTQGNAASTHPTISGDGRVVAFWSSATNLVDNDTNGLWDVFVRDLDSLETTRATVSWNDATEVGANPTASNVGLSLSEDGRYVAFPSGMTNLVVGDTNSWQDVFVRDLQSGLTERASVSTSGVQANNRCGYASISGDGRMVSFASYASNLVVGGTTSWQIYTRDLLSGITSVISKAPGGTLGNGSETSRPSISRDGRFVVFDSTSSNLVLLDVSQRDVFLYDGGTEPGIATPLALDEVRTDRLPAGGLQLYSLAVETPHKVLVVRVTPQENVNALELATRFNVAPLVGRYDERTRTPTAEGVFEIVTGPSAVGTTMLRVMAMDVAEPFGIYTIEAHLVDHYVSSVQPLAAGNAGVTTLHVQGANLDQVLAVSLRHTGGTISALETVPRSPTELWTRFDLSGAATGEYDVVLDFVDGGGEVVYRQPFVVSAGTGGRLESRIVAPSAVRERTTYSFAVEYANVGDSDLMAPLFNVSVPGGSAIRLSSADEWVEGGSIQVLRVNPLDPAGMLPPGPTGRVTLFFRVLTTGSEPSIDLETLKTTPDLIYWDDYWAQLRPATYTEEAWLAVWPAVQARLGDTWEQYLTRQGRAATRLRLRGGDPADVRQLFALEIMAAAGEPVAAISGRLVDADTAVPLVGKQIIARHQDGLVVRTETSDLGGLFSIPYLAEGIYELHVDGYVVTPTLTVNVSAGADAHGLMLLATPNPVEAELPPEREQYASPQLLDVDGTPHMVFVVDGQMYHTTFTSGSWATAQPIPGALGTEPRVVYASDLLDGTTPGLAVFWRTGTANDAAIAYAVAGPDGAGGWDWSNAAIYSDDPTAASTQPAAVVDANGEPIVVWQMVDYTNPNADRDLYYDHGALQSLDLAWDEILALAQLDAPVTAPDGTLVPAGAIVALTESGEAVVLAMTPDEWQHNLGFEWAFEKKGMVPEYVPIIGGKNIVQFKASLLGWYDSNEARATAGVSGEVSVMKNRVKGSVGGQFEAHWALDKEACVFNLDKATVTTSVGLQGRFPVPQLTWGVGDIFKVEFGVQVDGTLQGSLIWIAQGGMMPYGEVTGLLGLGLYGQIEAIGLVEGSAAGTGNVRADITRDGFTLNDMYFQFKGEVRVGVLKYEVTYRYPDDDAAGAMVSGATLGDALSEMLAEGTEVITTVTLTTLPGTTTVYTPSAVLGSIATDLVDDGPPSLVLGADGLAYLFWHRETSNPETTLGNTLAYATHNGTNWSAPSTLAGTLGFGREVAAVQDADGDLLVAWVHADEGEWTLASDPNAVSDACKVADVRYALLSPGGWSAPANLTAVTGDYMFLQLSSAPQGGVWATWVQMDTPVPTLFAALWDGSAWTVPVAVAQGDVQGSAPVLTLAGAPAAVWAQRTDDPELDLSESAALFSSTYDGATWSTPVTMTVAYSPPVAPTAEGVLAQAAGGFLDLPVAIPEEWCTPPAPGEDPPGGVDPGSEPIELPDPPEEYIDWTDHEEWDVVYSGDPNEKLGPLGFAAQRWIDEEQPLSYSIFFENIPSATAPAQIVLITDTLDVDLDWTSFTVTEIAYGDRAIPVLDGQGGTYYRDEIADYRPEIAQTWWVETIVNVDYGTGVVTATMATLDPETGEPPIDALAGFLPPNDSTGRGQGHISFSVTPDPGLADLTEITNAAEIVFDTNPPIDTNTWLNTIGSAYAVSVSAGAGGDVLRVPWNSSAFPGEVITFTAVPDPGWVFSGWTGDLSGMANPASLTVSGPVSVTANFTALTYTLDTAVLGDGTVVAVPHQETYHYNESVLLTATPGPGYEFVQWHTGSGTSTENPWEIRVRGDTLVTATFALPAYTIDVYVVGNGSVAKDPDLAEYPPGTAVTLTATADPGWSFVQWATGGITTTLNPLQLTVEADTVVTATLEAESYLLDVSIVGEGAVGVEPEQATYSYGEVVTLTATADSGWAFSGWAGDVTGTTNPLEITMLGDTAITATFEEGIYTLTVTVLGDGAVDVDPLKGAYAIGEVVTLTARPDPGRVFRRWGGDASGDENPRMVTIAGNTSITATFWRCVFLPVVMR